MINQAAFQTIADSKVSVVYPIYEDATLCSKVIAVLGDDIDKEISRKLYEITVVHTLGKYPFAKLYFVGMGKAAEMTPAKMRKAFATVEKTLKEAAAFDAKRAVTEDISLTDVCYYAAESFVLSQYSFTKINGESKEIADLHIMAGEDVSDVIAKAVVYGEAVNAARTLGNMPGNYMTPTDMAKHAHALSLAHGLEYSCLGKAELKELGAGALLGVNQGSDEEPKLIVLKYQGNGDAPFTALVGKGLTFDAGGYNIKTQMTNMKDDMCGGANVLGAMEIIARRKMKANVYCIVPATENMIDGSAYKSDDVLVSLSGKTIEVTNTDAEGRLILCDAITYAIRLGATRVIDVATLTGACVVALGSAFTGVFSNDDAFAEEFMACSAKQNERSWRMPVDEIFHESLKETAVADMVNSVKSGAGASVAACFLEEFVEPGVAWIHLDIAGTAFSTTGDACNPKGATGTMVRAMAALFE